MGGATASAIARRSDARQEACVSVSTSQGIGRRLRTSRRNCYSACPVMPVCRGGLQQTRRR
eukprot:7250401-Alexandrium_andersonii.AAC.1